MGPTALAYVIWLWIENFGMCVLRCRLSAASQLRCARIYGDADSLNGFASLRLVLHYFWFLIVSFLCCV